MIAPQKKFRFSYYKYGAIIPPQPMGVPFGFVLAVTPLLLPVISHLPFPREGLSPVFIQYLPNFWVLQRAGYVSSGDLALIEIFTGLYLLARLVYFFFFRWRVLSFFSVADPPPLDMYRIWPKQISGLLKVSAVFLALPLIVGPLVYLEGALSSKYAFILLEIFGSGWVALTEGLVSIGLYLTFKSKFWQHMPPAGDAVESGGK